MLSATAPTNERPGAIFGGMADYFFRIQNGPKGAVSQGPMPFPDVAAAGTEAGAIFADLAKNVAADLAIQPEWQIEVLDGDGRTVYRIKVSAEFFE